MTKFTFFLIVVLLAPRLCKAQMVSKQEMDSLFKIIKSEKESKAKADAMNEAAYGYIDINNDSAMYLAKYALSLSTKLNHPFGKAKANVIFGYIYFTRGNSDSATITSLFALGIIDKLLQGVRGTVLTKEQRSILKQKGVAYNTLAANYAQKGNYPVALKYFYASRKIFQTIQDKFINFSLNGIGVICAELGNYSEALDNFNNSVKVNRLSGDKNYEATALLNIANLQTIQGRYSEASKTLDTALNLFIQLGNLANQVNIYNLRGNLYILQGKYPEALTQLLIAVQIGKPNKDKYYLAHSYNLLGLVYKKLNKLELSHDNYAQALKIGKELGYIGLFRDIYFELSNLDSTEGNFKQAFEHYKLYVANRDSLLNLENTKKSVQLQMQYDFEVHQQADSLQHANENTINQINLRKQKTYTGMGILGFILVALLLFFVFRNYRNQRKANATLAIARQRAEESERFKQQFLANMSHEIRTPMNAVMGMTNLVLDTNLTDKQRFYLEGIQKSGNILLHVINDILDLSKIEAGKMNLEKIDFSVSELLQQVKQTVQHKTNEKGLQLNVEQFADVPEVIVGDPVRINQVLINLIGNAIKFTDKGKVEIKVEKGSTHGKLRFSVVDTGIGIEEDKLQTVFESFSQANASDTRKFGGTGLGLTISKQLVEMMGGEISVESKDGQGSVFSFEIICPAGSAERLTEQKTTEKVDASILDGLKILLVDDNEYNRIVANDTLNTKADVEIIEVVNGKEAVDCLSQQDFDLVLMDVQMPVMDGYEATRQIRNPQSTIRKHNVPIIALTSSILRDELDKCALAGMDDYIPKPFKAQQLIVAIAKATGRQLRFLEGKTKEVEPEVSGNKNVTDLTYLEEFCDGNKQRIKKYIDIFLASVPGQIEKISKALETNNWPEIGRQMHDFKTKLFMMGMHKAKDMATEIEMESMHENVADNLKSKVLNVLDQVKTATNELKA